MHTKIGGYFLIFCSWQEILVDIGKEIENWHVLGVIDLMLLLQTRFNTLNSPEFIKSIIVALHIFKAIIKKRLSVQQIKM